MGIAFDLIFTVKFCCQPGGGGQNFHITALTEDASINAGSGKYFWQNSLCSPGNRRALKWGHIYNLFFPSSRWGGGSGRSRSHTHRRRLSPHPPHLAPRACAARHNSAPLAPPPQWGAPHPPTPQRRARLYLALVQTLRNPPTSARRRPSPGQTWRPRRRRKSRRRVVRCSPGRGRAGPPRSPRRAAPGRERARLKLPA